jgi:UDP-glucose 4-epimerase
MKDNKGKNKYVVFGASGFIGKNIIDSLKSKGSEIIAISRHWPDDCDSCQMDGVTYVQADLNDQSSYCSLLDESSIVVDLAYDGLSNLGKRKYVQDVVRNIFPHIELFECCIERQVSGIIFVSSGGTVYGDGHSEPIDESESTTPTTSYACTKTSLEIFLKSMCDEGGVNYMILRPSNPYGTYQNSNCGVGLIARTVFAAYRNEVVNVFGDGSLVRDYLHVSDLCSAMVRLMNTPEAYGDVYNIGSSVGYSINDVITAVERCSSKSINVLFGDARHTDLKYNVLDCGKLSRVINWNPCYSLEKGIDEVCQEVRQSLCLDL